MSGMPQDAPLEHSFGGLKFSVSLELKLEKPFFETAGRKLKLEKPLMNCNAQWELKNWKSRFLRLPAGNCAIRPLSNNVYFVGTCDETGKKNCHF